jgi:hypothetical protein
MLLVVPYTSFVRYFFTHSELVTFGAARSNRMSHHHHLLAAAAELGGAIYYIMIMSM